MDSEAQPYLFASPEHQRRRRSTRWRKSAQAETLTDLAQLVVDAHFRPGVEYDLRQLVHSTRVQTYDLTVAQIEAGFVVLHHRRVVRWHGGLVYIKT